MGKNNQPLTPEELAAKVAELTDALQSESAARKQAQEDLSSLSEQYKQATAENEELIRVNEQLQKDLEALTSKAPEKAIDIAQKTAPKLSTETFKVDGVEYGFVCPAIVFKGTKITNEEILASTELQKELVDKKVGIIKQVS